MAEVDLTFWRGNYICYKRGGESQITSLTGTRPVPTKKGKCSGKYVACGIGSAEDGRTTCVIENTKTAVDGNKTCPITGATASSSGVPTDYSAASAQPAADDTTAWFTRSAFAGEMPINEVKLVLHDPAADGQHGVCFGPGAKQSRYGGLSGSYDYKNDYPKKCKKTDRRWMVLDSMAETDLLNYHFSKHDNCTDQTNITDYLATGNVGRCVFSCFIT